MNEPEKAEKECLSVGQTSLCSNRRINEAMEAFFATFRPDEARDILSKWMEVAMCCHDTLYDDWQERSAAFSLYKSLITLLESLDSWADTALEEKKDSLLAEPVPLYLNCHELSLLEHITECILAATDPEKVYCFGSQLYHVHRKGCLNSLEDESKDQYAFDLLLITRNGEKRPEHEIQEMIENRCRGFARLNAWVHSTKTLRVGLETGNLFFTAVIRDGISLHDQGTGDYPDPPCIAPVEKLHHMAIAWQTWSVRAAGFLQGVDFYTEKGDLRIAVFMLHQAAEHICTGIILALTGYRITTHNLDKLLRFINNFTGEFAALFPRNTEEEIRLFMLLQQAYTHSRYRDNYLISPQELSSLTRRIKWFMQMAEGTYARYCDKMQGIGSAEPFRSV
ncbi:MAG TPA: HEPN domain-containing protein [Chitinophagaceae bacterium]|nr:HEPN domain-containing protein [Chitinophagaceae bacterium]